MMVPGTPGPGAIGIVAAARSALFVPGDRPERYAKAAASGADVIIVDLEDAVAPDAKAAARAAALEGLAAGTRALVRVNAPGTPEFDDDVAALTGPGSPDALLGLVLPKVEDASLLRDVASVLGPDRALVALIESARGVRDVDSITAGAHCTRLAFGAIDFSLDCRSSTNAAVLAPVRSRLVVASRAVGLAAPLDTPTPDFRDASVVESEARLGHSFGFGGKLCIHPAQVAPVHAAFSPTVEEVAWALRVVEINVASGGAAAQLDGQMVDAPVVARAEAILSISHERQTA
ncbi:CoA ester lyase [Pseudarthrobacter sp. H3Y2-7]|uniref:HpcH/HpaI aldolase/citrate lyase family protein n=1 Tax=Pseudarthrobacter naphthalenicus TaxID=3031328 RepID=UPI0023B1E5EA|nr:CoA ester lyase [Pseudarthrobacter sp. H3Y2-7]MDE8670711.1 CoA ester lyase [Pseudarthrobacter sp. H3Y2-7]